MIGIAEFIQYYCESVADH